MLTPLWAVYCPIFHLLWSLCQCVPKFCFATISQTWYPRSRQRPPPFGRPPPWNIADSNFLILPLFVCFFFFNQDKTLFYIKYPFLCRKCSVTCNHSPTIVYHRYLNTNLPAVLLNIFLAFALIVHWNIPLLWDETLVYHTKS